MAVLILMRVPCVADVYADGFVDFLVVVASIVVLSVGSEGQVFAASAIRSETQLSSILSPGSHEFHNDVHMKYM